MTDGGLRRSPAAVALDVAASLRPQLWIAAVALFEAGRTARGAAPGPVVPLPPAALPALGSLLALLGAVHLGNGWRDRRSDRVNRKGEAIASGRLGGGTISLAVAASLLVAALLASASVVGSAGRLLLLLAAGLGAAYVVPPLELKRRAGFDVAAQAAGYGIVAFALGASSTGPLSAGVVAAALPYAAGIATVGVIAMIADREGDAAAGQRTTAVALGPAGALALAVALAVATAAGGLALRDAVPGLWGLVAAASLTLRPPPLDLPEAKGAGNADTVVRRGPSSWIRLAVSLQMLFALLLAVRSALPLAAALVFGGITALLSRCASGTTYPIDLWVGNPRGARGERSGERGRAGDAG